MEWTTINSYFKGEGLQKLVEHQVESFEDFIRNKIPLIVSSTAPIVVWHEQDETSKKYKYELKLSFENISYMKPRIHEATGRVKPVAKSAGTILGHKRRQDQKQHGEFHHHLIY